MNFNKLHLIAAVIPGLLLSEICLHPVDIAAQQIAAPQPASSQKGAMVGSVVLPPTQNKTRSFRGNLYRNRLAPNRNTQEAARVVRSPYNDVVISLHPLDFPAPMATTPSSAFMGQQMAQFQPRVLPITVGATVEFVNQDRFYHNVFSLTPDNRFNLGRKPTGVVVEHLFETIGQVDVFCDIHPQMTATVLVLDTPWFTQPDSTGSFRIEQLPLGRYRLQAYHPQHEILERQVEIGSDAPVIQSFVFGR